MRDGMYKTKCGRTGCEKVMYTYAIDRQGTLPTVYCSDRCRGEVSYEKRFKK